MSNLALLNLPTMSSDSFGHTAAMAGWVAAVEPMDGSVFVGYSNGVLRSEGDGTSRRRHLLELCVNGDKVRSGRLASAVVDEGHGIEALSSRLTAAVFRSEVVRELGLHVGAKLLPAKCNFTVVIDTFGGQSVLLIFEGGALGGIFEPSEDVSADVEIRGSDEKLSAWLADKDSRLGGSLVDGTVQVSGKPWVLSSFEYWAWCLQS